MNSRDDNEVVDDGGDDVDDGDDGLVRLCIQTFQLPMMIVSNAVSPAV